jgi:hypothetical protein
MDMNLRKTCNAKFLMCFFFRYVPILPMILVNGGEGIGTGWSCNIPNYK